MQSDSARQGILEILMRLYAEAREIELSLGIVFGGGDFRPRIEYFHDAVRAFASGGPDGRLTVEMLAYDLEALRFIQGSPLASVRPAPKGSPGTAVLAPGGNGIAEKGGERGTKSRIVDIYQQYGVLFSAFFRKVADDESEDRLDRLEEQKEAVVSALEREGAGKQALIDSAAHIVDPGIRTEVIRLLKAGRTKEALQLMREAKQAVQGDIRKLEEAHNRYAMAQLGLYEQGKDVVKQLADRGMNLAGRFVENAVSDQRRDTSRQR